VCSSDLQILTRLLAAVDTTVNAATGRR